MVANGATDACVQGIDTGFVSLGYVRVAVLGVVQGLTELLPISSTAHMRVVPGLLGWQDPGSAFSAAMQLAALAAVVSYYWRDVREIAVGSVTAVIRKDYYSPDFRFAVGIALATVPIVIAGVLLSPVLNACNSPLRTLPVIAWACVVMGLLLALAEAAARHVRPAGSAKLRDMLAVGLAQVGALVPGVSRSGSTLTGALMLGFQRADAARISFILGLPAILLAGLREIWILHKAGLSAAGWSVLAVGLAVASVSAFAAIWLLMRVLERFSAWPFVLYRIALGLGLLVALHFGLIAA
ncbi:undecaprenol kinase [Methylobacterium sp. 4-46]|uniref:undecaprenyl-diphosphate phosphatase n=1 Tax=unclassified Methylobacterium TaxID=2615210 RepID=UPI000152C073|nr:MULTISPECIES: undecaprenyl-diphosphate phosphatase [Methylobacterium]ACA17607.1 undecaprenol kinase [Methylobacterium sp. 4-46]WFT83282.1 undecaprenyl-diphosphate phosphatase [Methylobacterium nodulans]